MATTVPAGSLMPKGGYWEMPDGERRAFRRTLREQWGWPTNRTPTEKQMLLQLATYNRSIRSPIFFGGAMGGGKSTGLCALGIHLCRAIPGNRVLMGRKHFNAFCASTLQELEEQLAACPDARHWPGKHEVHFNNGSELWYMGLGDPSQRQKLGSTQFGAALLDEAPEIDFDVYKTLQTRVRLKVAGAAKRLVIVMTGNPYPGWIKQDFIKARKPGYTWIPSLPTDNEHLLGTYVEDMKAEMPTEWYRAFILGDWDAMVPTMAAIPYGLIEDARKRKEPPNPNDCVWGVDIGHTGADWTWIARRQGTHFDFIQGWGQKLIPDTADLILHHLQEARPIPRRIVFDYDGIGAGVADLILRAQDRGEVSSHIEIVGLHAQKTATIEQGWGFATPRYANMKSQNAFMLRRLLEGGHGDLPRDDEILEQDLTSANYDVIDGRVYMETKKLVRKKLGRSPDKGDAILLTMYAGGWDEIAGLPAQAEAVLNSARQAEALEDTDIERILQMQRRAAWYRNPFGSVLGRQADADDERMGY